jgi:threonylcarbamoyladenosine tRNA methylthiotransferase MtaB
MNRPYRLKDYTDLINHALAAIPDLGLGTDLMVGFPGETDEAFENTLRVTENLPFSYFHVFPYSPRPGTAAAKLSSQIPASVVRQRAQRLTELSRLKRLAFAERYIGSTVDVLFESGTVDGLNLGVTANFLKVGVPSAGDWTNQVKQVTVTGVSDRWAVGTLTTTPCSMRAAPLL